MATQGIALVPTLTILSAALVWLPQLGLAHAALEANLADARRPPEMTRRAAEAGVLVLAGTDAGMGLHGMVGHEVRHLVEAGVPQEEALAAASWGARRSRACLGSRRARQRTSS